MKIRLTICLVFIFFVLQAKDTLPAPDTVQHYLDSVIQRATKICNIEMDVALAMLEQAEKAASIENYPLELAHIWRIQGLIAFYKVNYSEALDLFIKSRDLFQQLENFEGMAKTLDNIAFVYSYQGLYSEALALKQEALKIRETTNDSINLPRSYNNIAVSYKEFKDYRKALQFYFKALEKSTKINKSGGLELYFNNIGDAYMLLGKFDSAFIYFNKALEYSILAKDKQIEANAYHYLGDYYMAIQNVDKGIYYYELAYAIYQEIGIIYELESIAESLHEAYAQQKNYKKAYKMHVLLKQMADSANSLFTMQKLTAIEKQAEFEKEGKLQQYRHELELHKQKLIRNYAILVVLAASIFLVILIYSNIKKKKLNHDLKIQRNEIQQQNEEILTQHDKILHVNQELEYQKKELETHRKNTLDSLIYAEHIQSALFPEPGIFDERFADHFIFYRPKDIVSGDFYWVKPSAGTTLIAVADSTGHGVPGAFMSLMGISFLNEIFQKKKNILPAQVLEKLREQVKLTLNPELKTHKSRNYIEMYLDIKVKDGMDIALCAIDHKQMTLTFSGANLPVFICRNKELITLKPNDNPVGVYLLETPFTNETVPLQPGDMIYLFSDGYYDQYGGPDNRKFYLEPFKQMLKNIAKSECSIQKQCIAETLADWQGIHDQIDDITIIGLRI